MENQKQQNEPEKGMFDAEVITKAIRSANTEDIRTVIDNIELVKKYVEKTKKKGGPSLMRYFDDKIFVVIGVVIIAIVSLFLIPDPSNVLMSIVSGLFGMATGRMMEKEDKE